MEEFIEYIGKRNEYTSPERHNADDVLEINLYCVVDGCNTYIKGKEGYNGHFEAETGQQTDLRNQCFICEKHMTEHLNNTTKK